MFTHTDYNLKPVPWSSGLVFSFSQVGHWNNVTVASEAEF